jgi:osmotically inducible protein OsmC
MAVRYADAEWLGTLKEGNGRMTVGSKSFDVPFTFSTRFEEEPGTNPEELIGAALAGCFSMALSADLEQAGFKAEQINTKAVVDFGRIEGKPRITSIHLITSAKVPGIELEKFLEVAKGTQTGCPIAAALETIKTTLDAKLV